MSDHIARSVISRIHLRELAMAVHYTGLSSDLRTLATAVSDVAQADFLARRSEMVAAYGMSAAAQNKPFAFSNGVAIIPVHGTLINRFGYSWGYVTGYNFIRQQTALAGQDPDVKAIVYDVNSYGGEAAGCFECASDIKKLAAGKPTLAMVDSNAYSGGYAIASGADKIVLTPSGGVGSIGVVSTHISYEQLLVEAGIKVTFIYAGDHKVDGNPYEDLSAEVKADIQKSVDKTYGDFVGLVAGNRSKMDEKSVKATQARIYRADDALSLGLIDAIASPNEALQAFMGELSGSNPQRSERKDSMSNETKPGTDQAAQDQARQEERARVSGIMGCEEAKGREALANHIALQTNMSVDDAKKMLAASPKVEAAPKTNGFETAMNNSANPNVGANTGGGNGGNGDQPSDAQRILAAARAAGVRGYQKPANA